MTIMPSPSPEQGGLLSRLLEAATETPAGSLLVLLSVFTNLANSVSTLGIEALFGDALTLCLSLVAAALWTRSVYRKIKRPRPATILDAAGRPVPARERGTLALMAGIGMVPVALALWTCRPLLAHGLAGDPWIFCGTLNVGCKSSCARLADGEERTVSRCLVGEDDTGYVELRRPHWYTYRPQSLLVACPGLPTRKLAIPEAMTSPECGGTLEIP